MTTRRTLNPTQPHPELDALLARAKTLPPMTPAQFEAQRRSWVIGEMMLSNPDMTRERAAAIYDEVAPYAHGKSASEQGGSSA